MPGPVQTDELRRFENGGGAVPVEALELFAEVLSQSEHEAAIGDDFYDRLCSAICRLAHLRRAIIFRYDPASRQVRAAGAYGLDVEPFTEFQLSVDTAPFAAQAIREDRVVETSGDVREQLPVEYTRFVPEPARMVCGPMVAAGRAVGVILAERGIDAPPLEASERHLLWTLGKAAALASVARNVATQTETARQLRQRIDLAREVHEGVIQRLFGISMVLDGAGDLPAEVRVRCASEIQAALGELRDAIQRPLGRRSRATQTTFAAELARVAKVNADFNLRFDDDTVANVPDELEPLAQSILAEALRNVRKHAEPTQVRVRTARVDGAFVLEVTNDGVPPGRAHQPGMGLRLAAFEALQSGGIVEFGPLPDGSWQVRLVVPHDG
ncbi:MAG: GAF domain-containing sensor histidine kinase [Solirubrobacteraceae bacterium]